MPSHSSLFCHSCLLLLMSKPGSCAPRRFLCKAADICDVLYYESPFRSLYFWNFLSALLNFCFYYRMFGIFVNFVHIFSSWYFYVFFAVVFIRLLVFLISWALFFRFYFAFVSFKLDVIKISHSSYSLCAELWLNLLFSKKAAFNLFIPNVANSQRNSFSLTFNGKNTEDCFKNPEGIKQLIRSGLGENATKCFYTEIKVSQSFKKKGFFSLCYRYSSSAHVSCLYFSSCLNSFRKKITLEIK